MVAAMMRTELLLVAALCACGPASRSGHDQSDAAGRSDSSNTGGNGDATIGQTFVYAHTSSALYRVDPDSLAISMVGPFNWSNGSDMMTDIAIDKNGMMLGISYTAVYRIDPATAKAQLLSNGLTGMFNGLSFVPATQLGQTGDDVLVATRNEDGAVFRVDPASGHTTQIGDMAGYTSSGDLVSVDGFGTVLTADNGLSNDRLVRLAPQTFAATPIGTDIGTAEIWGVAYWKNRIFGFTNGGQFILIDPTTGHGSVVQSGGPAWWGAAVTTSAPVIQ